MNTKHLTLIGIIALLVSACSNTGAPRLPYVSTPVLLPSPSISTGAQTARAGDIILNQTVTVMGMARLDAPVSIEGRSNLRFVHEVPEGELLFMAVSRTIGKPVYCTSRATGTTWDLGFSTDRITCFFDDNGDGLFEWVYSGGEPRPSGNLYSASWGFGGPAFGFPLETPIAYTRMPEGPFPTFDISIRFRRMASSVDSQHIFDIRVDNRGGDQTTMIVDGSTSYWGGNSSFRIVPWHDFPQRVEILNLEIEVLSFDEGEITYVMKTNQLGPTILNLP